MVVLIGWFQTFTWGWNTSCWLNHNMVDGRNPAVTSWYRSSSLYLHGFRHPKWCRISSISSITNGKQWIINKCWALPKHCKSGIVQLNNKVPFTKLIWINRWFTHFYRVLATPKPNDQESKCLSNGGWSTWLRKNMGQIGSFLQIGVKNKTSLLPPPSLR